MLAKILAATALLASTATALTTSSTPSWQVVKQVTGGSFAEFTAITAAGRNNAWAFDGQQGATAWERTGSTWARVPFPSKSDEEVFAAGASSASNVWALTAGLFGGQSRALRWNGSAWVQAGAFPQTAGGIAVLSSTNVWAFGAPYLPVAQLGAWHYNGRTWTKVASGKGLGGGSAVSAKDVWAYDGTDVANWNGSTWVRTNLASLLPANDGQNDPMITAIYAQSASSVYAIGTGDYNDGGWPTVVLHYNGKTWTQVAEDHAGTSFQVPQEISPDGHGGLWLTAAGFTGNVSAVLHYSDGHLTNASFPISASKIDVLSIAQIPGTSQILAGGYTHPAGNAGLNPVAVILQLGSLSKRGATAEVSSVSALGDLLKLECVHATQQDMDWYCRYGRRSGGQRRRGVCGHWWQRSQTLPRGDRCGGKQPVLADRQAAPRRRRGLRGYRGGPA
jgi:hypothetical protein